MTAASLRPTRRWLPVVVWAAAWSALLLLDGHLPVAHLALILVLAAAVSALWLPPAGSVVACLAAVLAFNVVFVEPRGTLEVGLREHLLLLATLLGVSILVALLTARQRQLFAAAQQHAQRIEQLRAFGEFLRDDDRPSERAATLRTMLAEAVDGRAAVLVLLKTPASRDAADSWLLVGEASRDERAGLWLCLQECRALGPGTGRHEEQPAWYLPMRGRRAAFGAALMVPAPGAARGRPLDAAPLLCDQLGLATERSIAAAAAVAAREEAQALAVRGTLLAAVAHDNRTPLATIVGAASALLEQGDRLAGPQRLELARRIVDEARQLGRLTDNALQLARLETPAVAVQADWESAEELVGAMLRRIRERYPAQTVLTSVAADLPLLRCDAMLIVQLLDNLVDNAIKYAGAHGPVTVEVAGAEDGLLIAVRDRGPGIDPRWQGRIFEIFQRGRAPAGAEVDAPSRRGAGVGLAVCRAIAEAHGGRIEARPRPGGGASFECLLPAPVPPVVADDAVVASLPGDDRP